MENITTNIAIDLIDDPQISMREKVDDSELDELMSDMREHGLIEPVVLNKKGNRFEVIAGYRRTRAARLLGWALIEAKVMEVSDEMSFALRLAENLLRKNVDPVNEARYIGEIILRTKKTPDEVAKLLHRSLFWINERLKVFEMPDYMKEHLKLKKYPLGAALELVQIQNEITRRYYANYASTYGVNVANARRWRMIVNAQNEAAGEPSFLPPINGEPAADEPVKVRCAQCGELAFVEDTICVNVHKHCPSLDEEAQG